MKDYSVLAGKKLRKLIKENYNSQEEFAEERYMDLRTLSRYINNGINKINTLQMMSEIFHVSITYFFNEDDEND